MGSKGGGGFRVVLYFKLGESINFPKLIFNFNFIKKDNFLDIFNLIFINITNKNELNRNKLCLKLLLPRNLL